MDASQPTMSFYYLTLDVLGVWRITHLLQAEDGPWDLVVRLRRAAGEGFWARVLDCFHCLSLWIAAPFAILLGADALETPLLWLALSAAAILLESLTFPAPPASAPYWKEENTDDMLRTKQASTSADQPDGR
jgi:hypothetical protein